MSDIRKSAEHSIILGQLKAKVVAADKDIRAELDSGMHVGDRLTAVYDGELIGAVSKTAGRSTATVTDPDKLAAWVAERYPSEVETKPVVRAAFLNAILDASKEAGEPCTPDGTSGVPGVRVNQGDPYLSVRPTAAAPELVARMVADGYVLPTGELRQIEGEQ